MVKNKKLIIWLIFSLFCIFIFGCTVDFFGFFSSSDLDERLVHKDHYSSNYPWDRTMPLPDDYSFIIISDLHFEDTKTFGLTAEKINDAVTAAGNVKFVVLLGDITQSGFEKEIDNFVSIARDVTVPVYPVIGNHDVYFGNWSLWLEKIGSTSYKIKGFGNTTLIFLDTANSYFGKEQLDWLEKEINIVKKDNADEMIFVFTHAPLFVPSDKFLLPPDFQQVTYTNERARILNMLKNKGTAMFMGHLHRDFTNRAGNVDYVSVISYYDDKSYLLVTVDNGSVTYKTKKF